MGYTKRKHVKVIPVVERYVSGFFPVVNPPQTPFNNIIVCRCGQPILSWPVAWVPPAYGRFPYLAANLFPARPVIPPRTRRLSELSTDPLPEGAGPHYYRFPYLAASLFPASPVIPPVIRRLAELDIVPLPEGARPRYQRFPYLDPSLFPASPVIWMRYGRDILADPQAFVPPAYERFPYFQEAPATANPVILFRRGEFILADLPVQVPASFQRFPYVSAAVTAANPVIAFRLGQLMGDVLAPVAARSGYAVFPYFQAAAPSPVSNPWAHFRRSGKR